MASGNLFGSSSNTANFGSHNQFRGFDKSMTTSSKSENLSLSATPQGLKEESSSLYSDTRNRKSKPATPMSATALLQKAAQMGSTRSNPSIFGNSFNVMSSSSSNTSNFNSLHQNRSELHQVFQNVKQQENFAGTVTLAMSDGVMGSSNLSSMNTTTSATATTSSTLNQLIMQTRGEQNEQVQLKLHPGSNSIEHSLTRDFLGMSGDQSGRPFLPQELAKFASMGSLSTMGLSQFTGNH